MVYLHMDCVLGLHLRQLNRSRIHIGMGFLIQVLVLFSYVQGIFKGVNGVMLAKFKW